MADMAAQDLRERLVLAMVSRGYTPETITFHLPALEAAVMQPSPAPVTQSAQVAPQPGCTPAQP